MSEFHYKTESEAVMGEKVETISIRARFGFKETVVTLETIVWHRKGDISGGSNKESMFYGSSGATSSMGWGIFNVSGLSHWEGGALLK